MTYQPLVSVILSFRNEAKVLSELISRLQKSLRPLPVRHEFIFVNDASTDNSLEILLKARETDPGIKVLNMSRRWGVSECTLAGIAHAGGDAVIMMDADLQDPPELLPELIARWQQGADVVNTVRRSRSGEPAAKMFLTRCAYRLIRAVSSIDLPVDAGDFKLLSRRAADQLIKLQHESQPYLRGLARWIGFNQAEVIYDRQPRLAGETHYSLLKSFNPLRTFLSGLISFSAVPLYLITLLALVMLFITVCGWIYAGIAVLFGWPLSWGRASFLWPFTLGSIQVFCLGIIGIYLGRIYNVVLARPNYIIASRIGFENKDTSIN